MRGQKEQVGGYYEQTIAPTSLPEEAAHRLAEYNGTLEEGSHRFGGTSEGEESVVNTVKSIISSTVRSVAKGATKATEEEVTSVSSSNFFEDIEKPVENMMKTVSKKTSIPFFVVFMIFLLVVAILALVFFCCLQRWWRKFRGKEGKGSFMGGKVDLKSVQLLGQAYKEKVQPDMEELTKDMEQNEAGKEDPKEEVKLGRLQFKIDYDFNQSTVSDSELFYDFSIFNFSEAFRYGSSSGRLARSRHVWNQ